MYARHLSDLLHRALASPGPFGETLGRFESLRGYGRLPRGRENAGLRLTDEQIASAVLGYVPTLPGWAGHVSLCLGSLCAVGGPAASIAGTKTLLESVTAVLADQTTCKSLVNFSLSIAREENGDEYYAKCVYEEGSARKVVSYVSHMAVSVLREGAEKVYDHERVNARTARQLVLARDFFTHLRREIDISRRLDLPFETDWREYETEEERGAFHRKLGARQGSCFLNLAVDTGVTWPKEPTRMEFGGHRFVLFPQTKDNSHSISIDLANERISAEEARTLLNRFLSLMSWCDDQHAVLKYGWSGNPVPVPIQRSNEAFHTTSQWVFSRSIPGDAELLQRLAYYREGLNARHAGLVTFEVLSFYKVFEKRERTRPGKPNPTKLWIARAYAAATKSLQPEIIQRFDANRGSVAVEQYLAENCRVATAHASEAAPSDADDLPEIRRLHSAADIIHALARYFIHEEYGLSRLQYSDSP
ncbi:methylamine utilization protein MauJ [Bosea thiooxidans]